MARVSADFTPVDDEIFFSFAGGPGASTGTRRLISDEVPA
jgi:hypothetical protein